jgi:hypothetical protein
MEKHEMFSGNIRKVGTVLGINTAPLGTKDHSRLRRALGYSFAPSALLQHQELLLTQCGKLMSHLEKLASGEETINMDNWCKSN